MSEAQGAAGAPAMQHNMPRSSQRCRCSARPQPARRRRPTRCSCVPGPLSLEAGLIYGQGVLLLLRTLLTDQVSHLEGRAGRWIIAGNFERTLRVMAVFVGVAAPAAIVNSGLK